MKHKLSKEICFYTLMPPSQTPPGQNFTHSSSTFSLFSWTIPYSSPRNPSHSALKMELLSHPKPDSIPRHPVSRQQHQLRVTSPRAHRTGIPLHSLVAVTKPLLSLPRPANSCLSFLQFSYLLLLPLPIFLLLAPYFLRQALQQSPK